ncbi:hypothetical protein IFO70_32125 [Phormidium tenue FACHB-886]|nr:hypothetical protein [Phormidium tenue FACHB-886]
MAVTVLLRVWALAGVTNDRATHLEGEIQQCTMQATWLGLKEDEVPMPKDGSIEQCSFQAGNALGTL